MIVVIFSHLCYYNQSHVRDSLIGKFLLDPLTCVPYVFTAYDSFAGVEQLLGGSFEHTLARDFTLFKSSICWHLSHQTSICQEYSNFFYVFFYSNSNPFDSFINGKRNLINVQSIDFFPLSKADLIMINLGQSLQTILDGNPLILLSSPSKHHLVDEPLKIAKMNANPTSSR